MFLLDLSSKRSEMKYTSKSKRIVLICLICLALKDFIEITRSMIVISLADEGLGTVKEEMVISSWCMSRNSQTDVNHPGVGI